MSDAKRERRRFVRRNHPDVGGDAEAFREGLRRHDAALAPAVPPTPVAPVVPVAPAVPPAPPAPPASAVAPAPAARTPASAAAREPAADRLAKGLGRFARRVTELPTEVKGAYRDGRDTDSPL